MNKVTTKILIIFLGIFTISCTGLVYSPSINLPDKIKKDETKIIAALEKLPSTGSFIDNGIIIGLQHSFSNNFCMQAKYWSDIDTYGPGNEYLHGASLIFYFSISDSTDHYKFYLAPTIGMSLNKNSINMGTIGGWLALQTPSVYFLDPYASLGIIYGNTDISSLKYHGFGILFNLGTYIQISKNLRFNLELSASTVYNMYFKSARLFITPTIGFSCGL